MSEQTLNQDNDIPSDIPYLQKQTSFKPAKLNLQRLETIQRIFKYGAGLVFIVFLLLIYLSYLELNNIKTEIKEQRNQINNNNIKIDSQNNLIKARFVTIANFYKYADSVEKAKNKGKEITVVDKVEDIALQNKNPADILPRIYLHIAREDQRTHAAAVAKQLEAGGFIVPGIQKVDYALSSFLKCFESSDIIQQDTTAILKLLRGTANIQINSGKVYAAGKIRPRHYEVWFGKNFTSYPD
jgi:hypothetical protein